MHGGCFFCGEYLSTRLRSIEEQFVDHCWEHMPEEKRLRQLYIAPTASSKERIIKTCKSAMSIAPDYISPDKYASLLRKVAETLIQMHEQTTHIRNNNDDNDDFEIVVNVKRRSKK